MAERFSLKLELVGTADTLQRFVRFLAFFHFNGGHSGLFAMPFDGDGHESLRVASYTDATGTHEGLPRELASGLAISQSGAHVEVADDAKTYGLWLDRNRPRALVPPNEDVHGQRASA